MYELISVVTEDGKIIENIPNDFHIPEDLKRFREITTNNIVFKTGVNDKLIQYQFDFDWGQSYKLII